MEWMDYCPQVPKTWQLLTLLWQSIWGGQHRTLCKVCHHHWHRQLFPEPPTRCLRLLVGELCCLGPEQAKGGQQDLDLESNTCVRCFSCHQLFAEARDLLCRTCERLGAAVCERSCAWPWPSYQRVGQRLCVHQAGWHLICCFCIVACPFLQPGYLIWEMLPLQGRQRGLRLVSATGEVLCSGGLPVPHRF